MDLYFDGAARPNPGRGGAGYVLKSNGKIVKQGSVILDGTFTNNEAEYHAVIEGLRAAIAAQHKHNASLTSIHVMGDSQLVIKQLTGEFKCHKPELMKLRNKVQKLAEKFRLVTYEWIPRNLNQEADKLAGEALDSYPLIAPTQAAPPATLSLPSQLTATDHIQIAMHHLQKATELLEKAKP